MSMAMLKDGKFVDTEDSLKQPTRAQYLNHEVSHEEYYRAIAAEAGVSFANFRDLPKLAEALKNGDEHFNHTPGYGLHAWDSYAISAKYATSPVFKAHGDFWSIAGGVCVAKQAAKDAAKAYLEANK